MLGFFHNDRVVTHRRRFSSSRRAVRPLMVVAMAAGLGPAISSAAGSPPPRAILIPLTLVKELVA